MDKENKIERLFILDDETKFLNQDNPNSQLIISESELENELSKYKNYLKAVIILTELDWEGKYLQNFYGFQIAAELRRREKLLCPIVLTSTLPQSHFEKLAASSLNYKILFGRGTGFVPLNQLDDNLDSTIEELTKHPLTEAVLADMNTMLLNQKGVVIDKLTHDLKAVASSSEISKIMDETGVYLDDRQWSAIQWDEFRQKLIDSLPEPGRFDNIKEELIHRCEQIIEGDANAVSEPEDKKRHNIIVLEDDSDFRSKIKENLKDHFKEIFITDQAAEAIQVLEEDENNTYTGILTDWRLYKGSTDYWQLQGYEVLDHAAKNRLIALFSLTSLADRNVHEIRNALGLDIHLFKKQHLNLEGNAQWDMMADTIRQKCDLINEIIASQPTGNNWRKLKSEYIAKRTSSWNTFEDEISIQSTKLFQYYWNEILKEEHKNLYSIQEKGLSLKNNLQNTLIIRRVYLGLYFSLIKRNEPLQEVGTKFLGDGSNLNTELKHHSIDAHSILKKDWWDDINEDAERTATVEKEWGKYEQRLKNLRGTLCIELTELPKKGLLPEEKNWFAKNNIDYSFDFNLFHLEND